jgi:hypothetical protein
VQSDEPTLPSLHDDEPVDPSVPTVPSEVRVWPLAGERIQRALAASPLLQGDRRTLLLGASLGANAVLFLGLLGLLLLSHAGFFAPAGSSPGVSGGSAPRVLLSSPTATSSAAALAAVGWLRVDPGSVQLSCSGDQQTQVVVLENTGPQRVQWQANVFVPGSADQASVTVDPDHGELDAGASMSLQIQYLTQGGDQQGIIRFEPTTSDAGPAPSLSYATASC